MTLHSTEDTVFITVKIVANVGMMVSFNNNAVNNVEKYLMNNRVVINTSGRDGQDGSKGYSGYNSSYGGYGSNGSSGQAAGDITVHINVDGDKIRIVPSHGTLNYSLPLGNGYSEIALIANGGNGGRGGAGGTGGDGANGSDGRDACRVFSGKDGEWGKNGGSGGKGGSGGNGGNAGNINVEVSEADADTLMLLASPLQQPGKGGSGGQGGSGGRGGAGGRGGRSYTYSTTRSVREVHNNVVSHRNVTEYTTVPGGTNGYPGREGSRGQNGEDGHPGRNARFQIRVDGNTYNRIYDLSVKSFSPIRLDDGICEPGETLAIERLNIENTGGMPTPSRQAVIVSLKNNQWISFDDSNQVRLLGPVGVRANRDVDQPLVFTVNSNRNAVTIDDTFVQTAELGFQLVMSRVNVPFRHASQQVTKLTIRYPAEISTIASDPVVGRGEELPFTIQLRNVSNKDLGLNARERRYIGLTLTGHDAKQKVGGVTFLNSDSMQTYQFTQRLLFDLEMLSANSAVSISGTLRFPLDTEAYQFRRYSYKLFLGKYNDPSDHEVIQERCFQVQIAERFAFNPNADLVLVVNDQTQKADIDAWKAMANQLGTLINIWNVSLYNGFSYTKKLNGELSFMDTMKDKVIIILNNQITINHVQTRATDLLDVMEIFEAAKHANIATYIVGGGFNLAKAIKPLQEMDYPVESIEDHKYFGRKPTREEFHKLIEERTQAKKKQNPDQRFVPVAYFQPECLDADDISLRHLWRLGSMEMRESLNQSQAHIIVHDSLELSHTHFYNVIKLLPFEKKLALFELQIARSPKTANLISFVILSDLADEMMMLGKEKWNDDFTREKLSASLFRLKLFINYPFNMIMRLNLLEPLVRFEYVARQLPSGFDKVLFPFACRRYRLSSVIVDEIDLHLKATYSLEEIEEMRELIKSELAELKREDLLSKVLMPYQDGVQYDHHIDIGSVNEPGDLPAYRRRFSMFVERQNVFKHPHQRNEVINKLKPLCRFELKK
jgi:hypothetical protein